MINIKIIVSFNMEYYYNTTSTHIDEWQYQDKVHEFPEVSKPKPVQIPGWLHINPISTQIDLESVAYQLSNYKYTEGMEVTYNDLVNPKPLDYPATPKFK